MPRKRHRYTRRLGWIKPLERASGGQVGMLYSPRTRRLVRRETTERCPSGRRGRPAKALYGLTPYRGFESLSLRQDPSHRVPDRPLAQEGMTRMAVVAAERIENRILMLRGHKVMLSPDLADLYDVEPRALVQAAKRN